MSRLFENLPPVGSLSEADEQLLVRKMLSFKPRSRECSANKLVMHSMAEAFLYAAKCSRRQMTEGAIYSLCFQALSNAARNFRPGRVRFFCYAKVYVRRAIFDAWRQEDVVAKVPRDHMEDLGTVDHGSQDFDFTGMDSGETRAELAKYMKLLTRSEQRVLRMYYFRSLTFEQIGDKLNCHRSWAQFLHQRALTKLQRRASGLRNLL